MIKITRSRTLLLFALITLCYFSCRKETENYTLSDHTVAQQLKEAYLSNAIPAHQLFSDMKPLWDKVYSAKLKEETVYEIVLSNPNRIFQGELSGGKSEEAEGRSNIRLVMTKSNVAGQYRSFYMSVINDGENTELTQMHYKNTESFSGRILFYSLKGEFINGWSYNAGEIVQSISAGTKKSYDETRSKRIVLLNTERTGADGGNGKISRQYWPGECHTETIATYGVSCVSVANYTNCSLYQTGTTYLTYCTEGGGGGGVGNPPGGGGGSGDVAFDCHGVMNGSATPAPCGCIGGTTGIQECAMLVSEIKVDTSARDCIDSIVNRIKIESDKINNCVSSLMGLANVNASAAINTLASSSSYKITISETTINDKITNDAAGNPLSYQRTNGITDPVTGNIALNKLSLNEGTDLAVAATLIHEMMHSYFVYGINHSTGNEKTFFLAMNEFLFDTSGSPQQNQAYAQHVQMTSTYVDSMASLLCTYGISRGILLSPDGSISLLDYCKDIFWRNLSGSQSYINAPNPSRAISNGDREYKNQSNSSYKKKC